ncbi:conserved hypothetical protein [Ricinus communis]|uniref:CCHC-type domain-containing protein n=1 Tax=Ricinus communis TaxID=3988 RepID=B9SCP2_RICCO|nr:conserved hypothetical protein [Ricinus communis]
MSGNFFLRFLKIGMMKEKLRVMGYATKESSMCYYCGIMGRITKDCKQKDEDD